MTRVIFLMAVAGLGWLTYLSPPLVSYLSPLQSGPRHPRARIGNALAPGDGRERTTMEGAGQPSGEVTNHSK